MEVTETVLEEIREMCLIYYSEEEAQIRAIIVYGGAARNYVGRDHIPGDFDLNIFFSKQSAIRSTYGMPKIIGEYEGLKVEVMRNKVPENMTIKDYVQKKDSKRWQRIREEPIVQIYPNIELIDW